VRVELSIPPPLTLGYPALESFGINIPQQQEMPTTALTARFRAIPHYHLVFDHHRATRTPFEPSKSPAPREG